jgi:ATP-dependent exoDNAse (exonuclease V) alpha subunit
MWGSDFNTKNTAVAAGEWITATGEWVNDRNHGQQFKARFLRTSAPTSTEGIEKYLSSGMIRGIGPVYARKLVRAFAEKVFDVIEGEPDRLREVGVGTARAVRIFKTYCSKSLYLMPFMESFENEGIHEAGCINPPSLASHHHAGTGTGGQQCDMRI